MLAGGLVFLSAAYSTAQQKAVPPPQPPPPVQPKTPQPAETPQKANPAVPGNQNKGTPPNPATPANPSNKASDKALQTPPRTGETPSRQTNVQLPQKAQTMLTDLGTLNMQNFATTTPTIANATEVLNQNQIQDLITALNSNPQAMQNAQRLTAQLRASGRIRPDQQVVGFLDGRLFVANVAAATNAAQLPQQAQNLLNGLTGLNLQNFNVSNHHIANANDLLNSTQVQDLIRTLNSNPQAMQMVQRLSDMLRATGRLQPFQQVVGFADGRIVVANRVPPVQDLVNGLANLNLQTFNPQGILTATDFLTTNQINDLLASLNMSPQARLRALQLTERLLADNRINPDQLVVGFLDGRVLVALTAQQFQVLINGLINADLQNVNQLNVISVNEVVRANQVQNLIQTMEKDADARRRAMQLTQELQSNGRIRRDQRVVGFMDGSAVVAPLPEK
jgi:hypothetical protein